MSKLLWILIVLAWPIPFMIWMGATLGLLVGTAGTAVYAMSRRGKGPTPWKVLQAVWGQMGDLYRLPIEVLERW